MKSKRLIKLEEILNSVSHGIGILLAFAGVTLLVVFGAIRGDAWHVVSFAVFGASMIMLYTASTIFHGAKNPRLKYKLNRFDHSAVFILIAGTYTPLALVSLRGTLGWVLFGFIWACAIAGVVFKVWFYQQKYRKISAWMYLLMGWSVIAVIVPVIKNVPAVSLWYILIGVLSYSASVFFYIRKEIPFGHLVFHLFVLGGSICHFFAFLKLVV